MSSLPIIKSEPLLITTPVTPFSLQQQQQQQHHHHHHHHRYQQVPWTTGSNDLNSYDLDLIGGDNGSENQITSLFEDLSYSSSTMFDVGQQQQMPMNFLPPSVLFEPGKKNFGQYFNTDTDSSII
jgi:hypothetical protein